MVFKAKNIDAWTVEDVQQWLDDIGLPALKGPFKLNAIAGDDLVALNNEDLMNHVGATALQARKILNEVAKVTGVRTDSMGTQRSQSMSPAQGAPPPLNQAPAVAYPSPQPAYAPSMAPAYSNSISQRNAGSQAVLMPTASGPPQNVVHVRRNAGGCCANDEMAHAIVTSPLPNVPMESSLNPPLPGQVIIGYEVCRYKVCKLSGLKGGAHGAIWGLCGVCICCALPLCWIPCVMPSCYGDYQRPLYGYPAEEGEGMSGAVSGLPGTPSGIITGGDESWKKTC